MNRKIKPSAELTEFRQELDELREMLSFEWSDAGEIVRPVQGKKIGYCAKGDAIEVRYDTRACFFREFAAALCGGSGAEERRVFRSVGCMVDNSRNAVMRPESVRELIRVLAVLGYDRLQLYTEDTYQVREEPYFGYLRGGYRTEELKALDAYAARFGIELVPCIQTLAHLRSIYRYRPYYTETFDCNDVLLVDSERTYELIEHMIAACAESFSSRLINVGMDEAFMLGRGKYLDLHGYADRGELYERHLERVCQIAEKYGFSIQLWGDMLCSEAQKRWERGEAAERKDEVSLITWHYGDPTQPAQMQLDEEGVRQMIGLAKSVSSRTVFCGGAAKWFGFTPNNAFSISVNETALDACEGCGVQEVMIAAWGDCGSETPVYAVLPAVAHFACRAYGIKDADRFRQFFSPLFGDLDSFLSIDCAMSLEEGGPNRINTSGKYLLYNDTFLGIMDPTVKPVYREIFAARCERLQKARAQIGSYAYLFDTQIALVRALSCKYDLGVRTRRAYRDGDREALLRLCRKDYPEAIGAIEEFFETFRRQWYRINRPHGFDVQEIRFGALLFRMRQNMRRIGEYCRGEIAQIEELEEELLDQFGNGGGIVYQNWGEMVSVNTLIEYFSYV